MLSISKRVGEGWVAPTPAVHRVETTIPDGEGVRAETTQLPEMAPGVETVNAQAVSTPEVYTVPSATPYAGEKFFGGLGGALTYLDSLDYWTIRDLSSRLFRYNTYAKGIIRRLVSNIVCTGLTLEAVPEAAILGLDEDQLIEWGQEVENRFHIWASVAEICDIKKIQNFGGIQREIYREAIIEGDCLVILRQDPVTKLPTVQVVRGSRVQTPTLMDLEPEARVVDGVKLGPNGEHLGYFVRIDPVAGFLNAGVPKYEFIPARGPMTGRRQAWMVYGFDKRSDDVRGEPLLSVAIQPLNEIDKYRDSANRKAYINSMIIGFIKRSTGSVSTLPGQGGAVRKKLVTGDDGSANPVTVSELMPGVFMERLGVGEEPAPYSINGADVNFPAFEAAIMVGIAWALEIPPEVLMLSFNKNYSASQAAINEFDILINRERERFAAENNNHIYGDWFLSSVLLNHIKAPGYLEAYGDATRFYEREAWTMAEWPGAVKLATDITKQTTGYEAMTRNGWITNARAARKLTGTKFAKNVRRLKKEREMMMDALGPVMQAEKNYGEGAVVRAMNSLMGLHSVDSEGLDDLVDAAIGD